MKALKRADDLLFPTQLLRCAVSAGALALLAPGVASAQTRFTPGPGQVVLPASVYAIAAGNTTLREAERDWRRDPQDIQVALRYARTAFQVGLNEGDLRWFGAAKAAMLPWWNAPTLPADGHFVRGLVRQGFHDFAGGLADFNAAIALDGQRWISSRPAFLLPVRVLGKLFRRLFLTRLRALHDRGQLTFFGSVDEQANIRLQTHGFTCQGIILQGHVCIQTRRIQPAHAFMDVLGQHNGFTAVSHIEHITAHQLIEQTTFTVIVFTDYGHRWRHVQLQENAQTIQIPAALWQHGQHRLQYLIKG